MSLVTGWTLRLTCIPHTVSLTLYVQDSAIQSDPRGHESFLVKQGFARHCVSGRRWPQQEAFFSLFNKSLARNFTDWFMTKPKSHAYSQWEKKKFLVWNDTCSFAFNFNQKVCKGLQKLYITLSWAVAVVGPERCPGRRSIFHYSYSNLQQDLQKLEVQPGLLAFRHRGYHEFKAIPCFLHWNRRVPSQQKAALSRHAFIPSQIFLRFVGAHKTFDCQYSWSLSTQITATAVEIVTENSFMSR